MGMLLALPTCFRGCAHMGAWRYMGCARKNYYLSHVVSLLMGIFTNDLKSCRFDVPGKLCVFTLNSVKQSTHSSWVGQEHGWLNRDTQPHSNMSTGMLVQHVEAASEWLMWIWRSPSSWAGMGMRHCLELSRRWPAARTSRKVLELCLWFLVHLVRNAGSRNLSSRLLNKVYSQGSWLYVCYISFILEQI